MTFFNLSLPIFKRKESAFAVPEMPGLRRVHWQIGDLVLWSSFYTQHDQACIVWGIVSAAIFTTAQFVPLSWTVQAVLSSLLTIGGVGGMMTLTWHFSRIERLNWVLYTWLGLMLAGIGLTDAGIFLHWGQVLLRICPLWLGLSAIGYVVTGIGMRSRTFILLGAVHLLTVWLLPLAAGWQQLVTGAVISSSVLLMAELQWDANGVCGYQQETAEAMLPTP